jgi:hypothetical protein
MDPLPISVHTTAEPFLEPLAIIGPSVYACLLSPVDSLYHMVAVFHFLNLSIFVQSVCDGY